MLSVGVLVGCLMTRQEELEQKCKVLFGSVTDIAKRLKILQDAFWQANNSGYCDAMANQLMAGHEDGQTEYWLLACSLRYEIAQLCEIYKAIVE